MTDMDLARLAVYVIGIPVIDSEHLEHAILIKELYNLAMSGNNAKDTLTKIELSLKTHIKHEEDIMEKMGYPFLEEHKKEHIALLNDFYSINVEYVDNYFKISIYSANEIFQQLLRHIDTSDTKLGDYYNKKDHGNGL